MPDKIALQVADSRIENFESYTVDSDLYTAADAFRLQLANPEVDVQPGQRCELYVNDQLEMTGIIDRVERRHSKRDVEMQVVGRDLMSLLVDSSCEEGFTLTGMNVKSLAERLLRNVPFINRKKIVYQELFSGKTKKQAKSTCAMMDTPHALSQVEPGTTIFEVLKQYAASRGMMFFALPDGTMVFGVPKAKGDPLFRIGMTREGSRNNALDGCFSDDISRRYSKYTVMGQQQGMDIFETSKLNVKDSIIDKEFPFYKPHVVKSNNDWQSPKVHARMMLERSRYEGWQLQYRVPGHSQDGRNWAVNELCSVKDDVLNVAGDYLLFGRTFELSKRDGCSTTLRLGIPGVVL